MLVKKQSQTAAAQVSGRPFASGSGNELIPLVQQGENVMIDAALLHRQLKAKGRFRDWISYRIKEYGFKEGGDFTAEKVRSIRPGQPETQYLITIDMAKELAMLERSEMGRQIRQYFILKEKELRGVSQLPAEAGLFKGLKARRINDRVLYPYSDVRERAGYSRHGGGSHKRRYWMHFVKEGNTLLVTAEFARHMLHSRQVIANRSAMLASQPVLALGWGTPNPLKGANIQGGAL